MEYIPAMATTSLPQNWTMVLDQIERTLAQAIGAAEAREASLPRPTGSIMSFDTPDVAAKYWPGLEKKIAVMEAPLRALDETLATEETDSRRHLAEIADLRRRLADWAGRRDRIAGWGDVSDRAPFAQGFSRETCHGILRRHPACRGQIIAFS